MISLPTSQAQHRLQLGCTPSSLVYRGQAKGYVRTAVLSPFGYKIAVLGVPGCFLALGQRIGGIIALKFASNAVKH